MRICIVSKFPPPIGGVTVYASRRLAELRDQSSSVGAIDLSSIFWVKELLRSDYDEYEINTLNVLVVFIFLVTGKINKSIFIDHNASRHFSGLKRAFLLIMLRHCKLVQVVNAGLVSFYNDRIATKVIVPFIPPKEANRADLLAQMPVSVIKFVESGPCLVNAAWKYIPYKEGDLYGLSTSLTLLECNSNIKLLLVIGQYCANDLPDELLAKIEKYKKSGRLCMLLGQYQLWPLLKSSTILLRLTPTDGDSVSIREALYYGSPVIASNCVVRPKDCVIYNYESSQDLVDKVFDVYSKFA